MFFRRKKSHSKVLKVLKVVFSFLGVIILVILITETVEETTSKLGNVNKHVTLVEGETTAVEENLQFDSGSMTGLNLLLINNITTEQYAKEYLDLLSKNANGELSNSSGGIPVELVLGSSITESGTYPGTPLPYSFLPWDSSSNSVHWNKAYGSVPADAMTLAQANRNTLNDPNGLMGSLGSVPIGYSAVGNSGGDNSVTPFQINLWATRYPNFPTEWKSTMNGYQSDKSRVADIMYFPDQLTALSSRFKEVNQYINVEDTDKDGKLSEEEYNTYPMDKKALLYAFHYNPGSGGATTSLFGGEPYSNHVFIDKTLQYYLDTFKDINKKYGTKIAKAGNYNSASGHAYVLTALVKDHGWKFGTDRTYDSYFSDYGQPAVDLIVGGGVTAQQFMDKNRGANTEWSFTRTTRTVNTVLDGVTIWSDGISLAKAYHKMMTGGYFYALMLQYAGLNVDPDDINTYLNGLGDDEWKPSGSSAWMTEHGLKPAEVGDKRTAFLNEAVKWKDSYYSNSREYPSNLPVLPKKDANGKWIEDTTYNTFGFDCSSLVNYALQTALKIDIGSSTHSQHVSSKLEFITENSVGVEPDRTNLKAGDLVFYYANSNGSGTPGHVAIYLGKGNWGTADLLFHAPQPGETVNFSNWDGSGTYSYLKYYRVKGID